MVRVGGSAKDGIAGGALRFEPNEMATGRPTKRSRKPGGSSAGKTSKQAAAERTQRNLSPIAALKQAVKKAARKSAKTAKRSKR
ncbi:MAG: hypothetical protein HC765_12865 [Brachymonas sp.]|nr:hypothetical protein [Brachymonas sp.]